MTALRTIEQIAVRELRSIFLQPMAWILLTAVTAFGGIQFSFTVAASNAAGVSSMTIVGSLFGGILFWPVLLASIPVIAMRMIAEERQTGTIESLLTAPVTENQVVAGKFIAALSFFAFLWSPLIAFIVVLDWIGEVDWWAAAAGWLGLMLVGAYLMAIALCASALARTQIVAFMAGFVLIVAIFLTPLILSFDARTDIMHDIWNYLSLYSLLSDFPAGLVSSRRLVYPISGTFLALFIAARLVESTRGK